MHAPMCLPSVSSCMSASGSSSVRCAEYPGSGGSCDGEVKPCPLPSGVLRCRRRLPLSSIARCRRTASVGSGLLREIRLHWSTPIRRRRRFHATELRRGGGGIRLSTIVLYLVAAILSWQIRSGRTASPT